MWVSYGGLTWVYLYLREICSKTSIMKNSLINILEFKGYLHHRVLKILSIHFKMSWLDFTHHRYFKNWWISTYIGIYLNYWRSNKIQSLISKWINKILRTLRWNHPKNSKDCNQYDAINSIVLLTNSPCIWGKDWLGHALVGRTNWPWPTSSTVEGCIIS